MNRVTITSPCMVDSTHKEPNDAVDDGDLHMACRCDSVKLPMVAEIVNAADFLSTVDKAKQAKRKRIKTQITGAWRIWIEHPAPTAQRQGSYVPVLRGTNPDHMFEIHPLTRFGTDDLRAGFKVIPGYTPTPSADAFKYYEGREFTVERKGTLTSIQGKRSWYNYAIFRFTVAGSPTDMGDGWAAQVNVDGVTSTSTQRVVAPDGTTPATLLSSTAAGKRYEAIGIPRIDLRRVEAAASSHPNQKWKVKGTYEMILVSLRKI